MSQYQRQAGDGSLAAVPALSCRQLSGTWPTLTGREPMNRAPALIFVVLMATAGVPA
jgi:hypothetical protein